MTAKEYELISQAKKQPISWDMYVLFIIRLGHCQTPNLTSTQLLGFRKNDFTPPPRKLNVSNISAVTDPICSYQEYLRSY